NQVILPLLLLQVYGWHPIQARDGASFSFSVHSVLAHSFFGHRRSFQTLRELYGIGIFASRSGFSSSFFLDTNASFGKADSSLHWKDRYWVKASVWIVIFSYVGNYFWTHYFFTVLGASYTFPSWKMNNVPHRTFLLTHVVSLFYHVTSNMTLRKLRHSIAGLPEKIQLATEMAWILALSYFIAYLETQQFRTYVVKWLHAFDTP
ncbi:cycloeucalenol cycloisomerase-like, partial [Hibiscus syriacus]|uniref:cycloeucalenol cycloisomerase-like n=1 Tax=Hibiscus syriacus TaxID=106335 RepID=UPI00192447BB